jgi:DNA-directed RNA polymerase subunit K/omega
MTARVEYITGDERRLTNRASKFEIVSALSQRMLHIENGAPLYTEFNYDLETIALDEILTKRCPFSVMRFLSENNGVTYYEIWDINELAFDKKELITPIMEI